MKGKRLRHAKHVIKFYEHNFGIRAPFRVLVDGTFCKAALNFRVQISEQLPKYVGGEVILCTTKCVLNECEELGPLLFGPLNVLRQFDVHPCGHPLPVAAATCVRNTCRKTAAKTRFFVATQDVTLSAEVRAIAGVPLLYISHNAITLEVPSPASRQHADDSLHGRLMPTPDQMQNLDAMKRDAFGEEQLKKRRKRKGPKEANPLSCKKAKKKVAMGSEGAGGKRRRTRKKQTKTKAGSVTVDVNDT